MVLFMAYENPLMTELMVPRDSDVASRLKGFYEAIGWSVRDSTGSEYFTYVNPAVSTGVAPTIAYWQTEDQNKILKFEHNDSREPTIFGRGLRLPNLLNLVEVCLVVPKDDDVHRIFERGGKPLEHHTHIFPRDHAGSQEFRFADPFNYSLRVTANPGWEILAPKPEIVLSTDAEIVRKQDFEGVKSWAGVIGQTWSAMLRAIERGEGCPLIIIEEDGKKIVAGDIQAGINWFNNRSINAEPIFVRLLAKISEQRQEEKAERP